MLAEIELPESSVIVGAGRVGLSMELEGIKI